MTGGGPGGYGPGGGGPPGGGYGPPPGGGLGGPPPDGGGFGGPPQGYGGPPPGGYGGPPMPPSPPQRSGPNVGLIVGLGCLGIVVLGGLGIGAVAMYSYRRASAIALSMPPPPPPKVGSTGPTPAATTGTLKAELRDLRDFKGTFGKARYFVGEIYNTGDTALGYPNAKVTLLDASSTAVDSGTCASVVHSLAPGAKVPCTFLTLKTDSFATTKIEITPLRAYSKKEEADLKVEGTKLTLKKGYSPHQVDGKITNLSSFKAKSVWALVSLYGADGKIVGAEQSLVAGSDLDPGSSALFSSKIYNTAATPVTVQVKAIGYAE